METVAFSDAYAAAQHGAVVADRSQLGWLLLTGATRVDLLQRMSTQDLRGMQAGAGRATVLTTDIGRMIDRLILYANDDSVSLLTGADNGDNIARYLMRFVFFNDDFQVKNLSADTAIWGVYGAAAGRLLGKAGYDVTELSLHHHRATDFGSIHRTDPVAGDGFLLVTDSAEKETLLARLTAAGCVPIDAASYDYLRIEAGQARLRHEISAEYNPLEAGLWDDVSFAKGCYTGQEIIARLESRGQLAKELLMLSASAPIEAGATITSNGKAAGTITSAATQQGKTVAMGYVKRKYVQEALFVGDVAITRTALPQEIVSQ